MSKISTVLLALFCLFSTVYANNDSITNYRFTQNDFTVEYPEIIVQGISQDIVFTLNNNALAKTNELNSVFVTIENKAHEVALVDGEAKLKYEFKGKETVTFQIGEFRETKDFTPIPLWMSVLPPLIAILMALVFREVFQHYLQVFLSEQQSFIIIRVQEFLKRSFRVYSQSQIPILLNL